MYSQQEYHYSQVVQDLKATITKANISAKFGFI